VSIVAFTTSRVICRYENGGTVTRECVADDLITVTARTTGRELRRTITDRVMRSVLMADDLDPRLYSLVYRVLCDDGRTGVIVPSALENRCNGRRFLICRRQFRYFVRQTRRLRDVGRY